MITWPDDMKRATREKIEERLAAVERARNVKPLRHGARVIVRPGESADEAVARVLAARPGYYDPAFTLVRVVVRPPERGCV